jgi:hypothetical protein
MDLQTIDYWPVSNYNFTGNGTVTPAGYVVGTGTQALPAGTVAGSPLWIDGVTAPFGSAPPDFEAFAINPELSVPARLQVDWNSAGTIAPFATLTSTGLTINLSNPSLTAAVIRIGSESIALSSLAATPQIVPPVLTPPPAGLPAVFQPVFAIGNLSAADTTTITITNTFATFATQLPTAVVAATPAHHFVATGVYNRGSNTFTASSIDVVN